MCIRNTPPTNTIFKTIASIFDHLCHVLLPFKSHQIDQRSSNLETPSKLTSRTVKTKGGVFGQVDGAEMLEDQYRIMGPLFSLYGIFCHWRHREIRIGKCLWLNKLGSWKDIKTILTTNWTVQVKKLMPVVKGMWQEIYIKKQFIIFVLLFLFLAITLAKSMDIKYNTEHCQAV